MLKDKQHMIDMILKTNCMQGENLKLELHAVSTDWLLIGNRRLGFM